MISNFFKPGGVKNFEEKKESASKKENKPWVEK